MHYYNWDRIIRHGALIREPGERIGFLSYHFLEIPYRESTLIGSVEREEKLVINLEEVDCLTFIEYVEAMRLSSSFEEFRENLKSVRYYDCEVSYQKRRHFFTDWIDRRDAIYDATPIVGRESARAIRKWINLKDDNTFFIPAVTPVERKINYIPAECLKESVMNRLHTGDYAGIYTTKEGLDVTHTGIIIKKDKGIYLRHASSMRDKRKVVDEDFPGYMKGKDGLILLRPL